MADIVDELAQRRALKAAVGVLNEYCTALRGAPGDIPPDTEYVMWMRADTPDNTEVMRRLRDIRDQSGGWPHRSAEDGAWRLVPVAEFEKLFCDWREARGI